MRSGRKMAEGGAETGEGDSGRTPVFTVFCQIENRTHIREPVKPTAPADTVTGVRRSRQRVVDKSLWRR
jgi:hypothetical protein